MLELAAKTCVFHFNKKHLEDPTIPMWVLKLRGKTLYLNQIECNVKWSTRESPSSSHTKGSILLRNVLVLINEENEATLSELTPEDRARIRRQQNPPIRAIWAYSHHAKVNAYLNSSGVRHGKIRYASTGACGTTWMVCEFRSRDDLALLVLTMSPMVRELMPNEWQYARYDDPKGNDGDDDEYDEENEE